MNDALKNEHLKREAAARERKNMGRSAKLDAKLETRFDDFVQEEWLRQAKLRPTGGSARAKSPAMIKTLLLEEAIADLLKKHGK